MFTNQHIHANFLQHNTSTGTSLFEPVFVSVDEGSSFRADGGEGFTTSLVTSFLSFFLIGLGRVALAEIVGRTLCFVKS